MGETFPTFADADDRATELAGAIDDGLYDGIQSRNVAAAGEDGDFVFGWHWDESPSIFFETLKTGCFLDAGRERFAGAYEKPQGKCGPELQALGTVGVDRAALFSGSTAKAAASPPHSKLAV